MHRHRIKLPQFRPHFGDQREVLESRSFAQSQGRIEAGGTTARHRLRRLIPHRIRMRVLQNGNIHTD
jgi:hypothetical protein